MELGPDRVEAAERRPDGVAVEPRPDRAPLPASASGRPAVIQPLAPSRYKVQFTASAEFRDKLERLQALTGSRDLASILEEAITEKLERLERRRFAKTSTPRKGLSETDTSPSSRYVPAAVRRAVHERDGSRCRYVDKQGRQCPECVRLEYHHRYPFGMGGDHRAENVSLMCDAHNAYLAEHDYGWRTMAQYRRSGNPARPSAGQPRDMTAASDRPPASAPKPSGAGTFLLTNYRAPTDPIDRP